MSLTVALATRNNSRLLASTLRGFCQVQLPCSPWKLVVIDNGSSDDTDHVLKSFSSKLPLVTTYEPKPGKSRALNLAIPLFEGELTVLTDDDVMVESDWLVRLWEAAQEHKEYSIFGGQIRGSWPGAVNPQGFHSELLGRLYAITPPELCDGPMNPGSVWGPNMAIRTAVFQEGHRFDEEIGPDGTDDYPMGDETAFARLLARHGHRAWHVSRARVHHKIRPDQLDRRWMLRRARRLGRGECRRAAELGPLPPVPTLLGYPRWIVRRLIELRLRSLVSRGFEDLWEYYRLQGYALETKSLQKQAE